MMKGIVIATHQKGADWLRGLLDSLQGCKYPILVVGNGFMPETEHMNVMNSWNGYELGAIAWGIKRFGEFIFLPDSCIVKDQSILDKMFDFDGSVYLSPGFFHYMGKYRTQTLNRIEVPKIDKKEEAITFEHVFGNRYMAAESQIKMLEPCLPVQSEVFEVKNGRKNMVVENEWFKKWKGTYR